MYYLGSGCNLRLNVVALPQKDWARSLGMLLLNKQAVVSRAFYQLRLVQQLRPFLEQRYLGSITHASVASRLNYCNTL